MNDQFASSDQREGYLLFDSAMGDRIGPVYGLVGSAAVALLVLAEIHDLHWAIAYLLVFCIDTIAGMMLVAMMIGTPFASIRGLGVPVTGGLFATHSHWTSH